MTRWWNRFKIRNGEVANAIQEAEDQRAQADEQTSLVNRTISKARGLTYRTSLFIDNVERSWRPKESR